MSPIEDVEDVCEHWRQLISLEKGETESGSAALWGFCLLKILLTSLSRMVLWEEGACEVGSY